jgi:hypothetical protein
VGGAIRDVPLFGDLLRTFTLTSYNFLLYGIILVLFMLFRPEGLLPAAIRKAELHGEGVSAAETFGTSSEVAEAATDFEENVEGRLPGAPDEPEDGAAPPAGAGGPA